MECAASTLRRGENVVYFEGDMVIKPGAGNTFRALLSGPKDFDVGYTYLVEERYKWVNGHCGDVCGDINSGVIVWKNVGDKHLRWNDAVVSALYAAGGERFNGGENQKAIDDVIGGGVGRLIPEGELAPPPPGHEDMRVLSLSQNLNVQFGMDGKDKAELSRLVAEACCDGANPGSAVLHYSGDKMAMVNKCCVELAFGNGGGGVLSKEGVRLLDRAKK